MAKTIVGSILHGAYGDLYEQALCLKHYAATHPDVELRLFAASTVRLDAFRVLDLSFASTFELWSEIPRHDDIGRFLQFQVHDGELKAEVLSKLPSEVLAKIDRERNLLPWTYLRDNHLVPPPASYQLTLSPEGTRQLAQVAAANGISDDIWQRPTISFLWRYRVGAGAISSFGQKSQQQLVASYSAIFRDLIAAFDCHFLVCGMNVVTDESNRATTDNKYPPFGLELPASRVTYMKGLSWPLELEIASRATVSCGHASGFTEGQWLKRGRDMVLMDAPPHYLAKVAYHRMPLFHLDKPFELIRAMLSRSATSYKQRIARMLKNATL